jgi:4-aminobutyrate aminotransferase
VCGKAAIMDAPAPGGLGGTYAANALAVASAHAVLDVLADEKLADRADRLGRELRQHLEHLKASHPDIAEVRGLGSMIAIEFRDARTGEPLPARLQEVQRKAMQEGLLLLSCGIHGNAIRFLYPLTIPDEQFKHALGIIERAMKG